MEQNNKIALFQEKHIRKVWHNEEWYFSVIDIISLLTDTTNPTSYWSKTQKTILAENEVVRFWHKLKLEGKDSKKYPSDVANTEGVLRIIMSVPSPKAEPLKLWLAEQGKRTIDETNDPELLTQRQIELYKAKGYTDEWITRRIQTIETRKELTGEWQKRGIKEGQEYSILTATVAKGTFGLTPSEHGKLKGLENQNLRDHMTPLELILTALGEEVTKTIVVKDNAQGFEENHDAAIRGGKVGKIALDNVERETGVKVVSTENYLHLKDGKTGELPESPTEPEK
jgi:DNA-damage-inducible protein D